MFLCSQSNSRIEISHHNSIKAFLFILHHIYLQLFKQPLHLSHSFCVHIHYPYHHLSAHTSPFLDSLTLDSDLMYKHFHASTSLLTTISIPDIPLVPLTITSSSFFRNISANPSTSNLFNRTIPSHPPLLTSNFYNTFTSTSHDLQPLQYLHSHHS